MSGADSQKSTTRMSETSSSNRVHIKAQFMNVKLVDVTRYGNEKEGGPYLSRWGAIMRELEDDGGDVVAALDRDLEDNWHALVAHTDDIANSIELPIELDRSHKYKLDDPEADEVSSFVNSSKRGDGEDPESNGDLAEEDAPVDQGQLFEEQGGGLSHSTDL